MARPATMKALGEFALIARIARLQGPTPLTVGIGDDAAVFPVPPGCEAVVTTDLLVEDVHFRRRYPATSVGRKAVAVNVSDVAAMGARPLAAFLSLAVPPDVSVSWVRGFTHGFLAEAKRVDMPLAGGDTTASPGPIVINVAIVAAGEPGRLLRRDRAQAGDTLWVAGALGHSRAGLELLETGMGGSSVFVRAHLTPRALLAEGRWLAHQTDVHAAMDVSDGLAGDAAKLATASGLALEIDTTALPVSRALERHARAHGFPGTDYALYGGEDYALLFAAHPYFRPETWDAAWAPLTRIGRFRHGRGVRLRLGDGTVAPVRGGYDHFRSPGGRNA